MLVAMFNAVNVESVPLKFSPVSVAGRANKVVEGRPSCRRIGVHADWRV